MLPHLWLWSNFASIKNFGGLSAPPVICPYRAEQATGLAGGYDYFLIFIKSHIFDIRL